MNNTKYKSKRFLLPILSLVLISIIVIASVSSYLTINMFKSHMEEHIVNTKNEYTQKHKNKVQQEVDFANESIKFQISQIENKLKESLKEKVLIALNITKHIYNTHKDTHNKEQLKEKISAALAAIKYNDNRGYYFMYDNKTKIIFGHPMKKFIGKDMTKFKDVRGQNLMQLDTASLKNNKIAYSKIYFNKPNNQKDEFPKITCITKFEALDVVIGIGEYLDVIENRTKEYVLNRFSKINSDHDQYLFIMDIHNFKGGNKFATLLLNSNRPDLVGVKLSSEALDIKGKAYRKEFLKLVNKEGGGFTDYWYKKPSSQNHELKVSYVYLQKDWNWLIASGFYYGELEEQIQLMKESVASYTNDIINKTLIWVISLSFIAILLAIFVSFRIDKTIKEYTNEIVDYENNKREQEHLLVQQSKLASMGEMLNNIAHQWRQPLSTISTVATGTKLQKELDSLSDEQLLSALDTINLSSQYLSQTIDDFRSFFNPKNSKLKKINLSELLDKTLNIIESQFKTKEIEIIKDIQINNILLHENELMQVLMNILNNAKDSLELQEVTNKLIFITAYMKEEDFYIEILDNAGGIDDSIIDRVFEPYFTTKHQSQGTGIGLYMSQSIVQKHLHGTIKVVNKTYEYDEMNYTGALFTIKIS